MNWAFYLYLSIGLLAVSVVLAFVVGIMRYRSGRMLAPSKLLFGGVIASSFVLFLPIYLTAFVNSDCGMAETLLIAIHNVIRLFVVDGEFSFITDHLAAEDPTVYQGYTVMFAILFVMAPALTFSFVLSFFKNVSAYQKYWSHFYCDTYIFSELNEKSLALAKSLHQAKPRTRLIVFTDVFEREEEQSYELVERAKELGAVCFKKDIVTINFSWFHWGNSLSFFTIGEDQSENVNQALKLVDKFRHREKTNLYVFSTQIEAEMLLGNAFSGEDGTSYQIKVRRVNEVRSLISRTLYDDGYEKIFQSAQPDAGGEKQINALVVGMGFHGTEMTKALSWFCQMDGYFVTINAVDLDAQAPERFASLCPELMQYNGCHDQGDARYQITVHGGVNVETGAFDTLLQTLPRTTYVFVALGQDELNISAAVKIRMLCERMGCKPVIQAVVTNSEKKQALTGIVNFKGQAYAIDFIGDIQSSFTEAVILDSEVEEAALARHLKWGKEEEFWQFDYNYKSSVASAIHRRMKEKCGIPGIHKAPSDRTPEELWGIRKLEHSRWNAYMRSEGYVYGGTTDRSGRNDMAKKHNCLVPFEQLPLKEQEKDDD